MGLFKTVVKAAVKDEKVYYATSSEMAGILFTTFCVGVLFGILISN